MIWNFLITGNQVQGIDEGEAEFLDFVSKRRDELTKARNEENESVLQEYRVRMRAVVLII